MTPTTTTILLIRHGETAWNAERRIQGQLDVPLSPLGETQARLLGGRLKSIRPDAAYTSDSARSARTAEIALEGSGLAAVPTPALRECGFGRWEGLVWPEIEKSFPEEARRFRDDPAAHGAPGGETWNQMQARVFQKVREIARAHPGGAVAVFTHGGPCKAAVMAAMDLPARNWRRWVVGNASIQRLTWEPDGASQKCREGAAGGADGVWKWAGFNDAAHLEQERLEPDFP
jgi:probable phosphoglycerate mutase